MRFAKYKEKDKITVFISDYSDFGKYERKDRCM
jgi:hypothetical protein